MLLYQPSKGYRYNSDSIFLYQFIRRFSPRGNVLDVGSGVGVVGLLAARDFKLKMDIVDKQQYLVEYAQHNYKINDLEVRAFVADFAEFGNNSKYDYILSNPPFYDSAVIQSQDERLNIARYSHHLPIDKFVSSAKKLLKPKGYLIFCYDAKQTDRVLYELKSLNLNPEEIRFVHPKADKEAKIVFVAARGNSRSMLRVLPPLIVFDDNSNYSAEAINAFNQASTHVITADREGL